MFFSDIDRKRCILACLAFKYLFRRKLVTSSLDGRNRVFLRMCLRGRMDSDTSVLFLEFFREKEQDKNGHQGTPVSNQ